MFGKVKLFFGIEGLKLDLDVPANFSIAQKSIVGTIKLHTKSAQTLTHLQIKLVETYTRGRGADKRVNDLEWGSIILKQDVDVPAYGEKVIDFQLSITPQLSKIDQIGNKNKILKKVADLARIVNNTKSEFNIVVTAEVKGTALNPVIKRPIAKE